MLHLSRRVHPSFKGYTLSSREISVLFGSSSDFSTSHAYVITQTKAFKVINAIVCVNFVAFGWFGVSGKLV